MTAIELAVMLAAGLRGATLTIRGALLTPHSSRDVWHGVFLLALGLGYCMRFSAARWALAAWSFRDVVLCAAWVLPLSMAPRPIGGGALWLCLLEPMLVALLLLTASVLRVFMEVKAIRSVAPACRAKLAAGDRPIGED